MIGHVITYKTKSNTDRALFNHALYGRLVYKTYRGRKVAYYFPGMLDSTRFCRLVTGRVFIERDDDIDIETLKAYANVDMAMEDRDENQLGMVIGKDYWNSVAAEKGFSVRVNKKKLKS